MWLCWRQRKSVRTASLPLYFIFLWHAAHQHQQRAFSLSREACMQDVCVFKCFSPLAQSSLWLLHSVRMRRPADFVIEAFCWQSCSERRDFFFSHQQRNKRWYNSVCDVLTGLITGRLLAFCCWYRRWGQKLLGVMLNECRPTFCFVQNDALLVTYCRCACFALLCLSHIQAWLWPLKTSTTRQDRHIPDILLLYKTATANSCLVFTHPVCSCQWSCVCLCLVHIYSPFNSVMVSTNSWKKQGF